jgi:hypothetical protein
MLKINKILYYLMFLKYSNHDQFQFHLLLYLMIVQTIFDSIFHQYNLHHLILKSHINLKM